MYIIYIYIEFNCRNSWPFQCTLHIAVPCHHVLFCAVGRWDVAGCCVCVWCWAKCYFSFTRINYMIECFTYTNRIHLKNTIEVYSVGYDVALNIEQTNTSRIIIHSLADISALFICSGRWCCCCCSVDYLHVFRSSLFPINRRKFLPHNLFYVQNGI